MSLLKDKKCVPCKGGVPPIKGLEMARLLEQLGAGWLIISEHHLEKEYKFKNFRDALAFVNRIGALAETEGHHPDLFLGWGKVRVILFTHKVDGLTENDFILAAKFEDVFQK